MSKKTKTYVVVALKSPESTYSKIIKMQKTSFDKLKDKKFNKYDPVLRKHLPFSLKKAK